MGLESVCESETALTADTEGFERRQRSRHGIERGLRRGRIEGGKAGLILILHVNEIAHDPRAMNLQTKKKRKKEKEKQQKISFDIANWRVL